MSKTQLPAEARAPFEALKQAIERAITSCKSSGNDPTNHFAGAGKMVDLGSGSQRQIEDCHLSRFACYLIAQNGDPRKPEIAYAQKYFAVQAVADSERLGRLPGLSHLKTEDLKKSLFINSL